MLELRYLTLATMCSLHDATACRQVLLRSKQTATQEFEGDLLNRPVRANTNELAIAARRL